MGPLARLPLHPLLLAAYAVLFVYAANIDEVLPADLLGPLLVALAAAAVVLALCALLYRDLRRGAVLASAIVLAVAFFGHLGSQLDEEVVGETVQLLAWAALIVAAGVYAWRADRVAAPGHQRAQRLRPGPAGHHARHHRPGRSLAGHAGVRQPARQRRRHRRRRRGCRSGTSTTSSSTATAPTGPSRSASASTTTSTPTCASGASRSIPGARANYRATDFSLASTLSMDMLDDLTASVGPESSDRTPARAKLGDHEVGRFLRANGYRYYHLGAWYGPTLSNPIADEVRAWGKTTEFEPVLRDATMLPALERLVGRPREDDDFRNRHREEALFAFRQLPRLADEAGRKFVFAHILLPHPPYGFDADGGIVLKETEKAAIAEGARVSSSTSSSQFTNRDPRDRGCAAGPAR